MCGDGGKYVSAKDPEDKLSDLLFEETGVRVGPKLLRLFLKSNWDRVAMLAHKIHATTTQA